MTVIGALGVVSVRFLRLGLLESRRWLTQHGRLAEAHRITAAMERHVIAETGRPTLLLAQRINVARSLQYTTAVC